MKQSINIIKEAEAYIEKYGVNTSIEELFIEFKVIVDLHEDFEFFLKQNGLNEKLERMQRSERLLEKRRLFSNWYVDLTQNKVASKEAEINLSETVFVSVRTVQKDLKKK